MSLPNSFEPSRLYSYVRARELEGTMSADKSIGCWPISAMRIAHGWGDPGETAWPYDAALLNWPPVEPFGLDNLAKAHRIRGYQRARSFQECKHVLAKDTPVLIALSITDQWYSAYKGIISDSMVPNASSGSHSIVLVGYDDASGRFTFRNSWGTSWGDQGYGTITYQYFDSYFSEAWSILPILESPPLSLSTTSLAIREWGMEDLLGRVVHAVEITNYDLDEKVAWAFATVRDSYLDVEELFVKDTYRRNGLGRQLWQSLQSTADKLSLPLRGWISHADRYNQKTDAFMLDLRLKKTVARENWAAYLVQY